MQIGWQAAREQAGNQRTYMMAWRVLTELQVTRGGGSVEEVTLLVQVG